MKTKIVQIIFALLFLWTANSYAGITVDPERYINATNDPFNQFIDLKVSLNVNSINWKSYVYTDTWYNKDLAVGIWINSSLTLLIDPTVSLGQDYAIFPWNSWVLNFKIPKTDLANGGEHIVQVALISIPDWRPSILPAWFVQDTNLNKIRDTITINNKKSRYIINLVAVREKMPSQWDNVIQVPESDTSYHMSSWLTDILLFYKRSREALRWVFAIDEIWIDNEIIKEYSLKVLTVVNYLFLIVLLWIALMWNFSSIISHYQIKKTILYFFMAMILMNFSGSLLTTATKLTYLVENIFLNTSFDQYDPWSNKLISINRRITADDLMFFWRNLDTQDVAWMERFESLTHDTRTKFQVTPSDNIIAEDPSWNITLKSWINYTLTQEVSWREESYLFESAIVLLYALGGFIIAVFMLVRYVFLWFLVVFVPVFFPLFVFKSFSGFGKYWAWLYVRWLMIGPILTAWIWAVVYIWNNIWIPIKSIYSPSQWNALFWWSNVLFVPPGSHWYTPTLGWITDINTMMSLIIGLIMLFAPIIFALWLSKKIFLGDSWKQSEFISNFASFIDNKISWWWPSNETHNIYPWSQQVTPEKGSPWSNIIEKDTPSSLIKISTWWYTKEGDKGQAPTNIFVASAVVTWVEKPSKTKSSDKQNESKNIYEHNLAKLEKTNKQIEKEYWIKLSDKLLNTVSVQANSTQIWKNSSSSETSKSSSQSEVTSTSTSTQSSLTKWSSKASEVQTSSKIESKESGQSVSSSLRSNKESKDVKENSATSSSSLKQSSAKQATESKSESQVVVKSSNKAQESISSTESRDQKQFVSSRQSTWAQSVADTKAENVKATSQNFTKAQSSWISQESSSKVRVNSQQKGDLQTVETQTTPGPKIILQKDEMKQKEEVGALNKDNNVNIPKVTPNPWLPNIESKKQAENQTSGTKTEGVQGSVVWSSPEAPQIKWQRLDFWGFDEREKEEVLVENKTNIQAKTMTMDSQNSQSGHWEYNSQNASSSPIWSPSGTSNEVWSELNGQNTSILSSTTEQNNLINQQNETSNQSNQWNQAQEVNSSDSKDRISEPWLFEDDDQNNNPKKDKSSKKSLSQVEEEYNSIGNSSQDEEFDDNSINFDLDFDNKDN